MSFGRSVRYLIVKTDITFFGISPINELRVFFAFGRCRFSMKSFENIAFYR